jgi:PTH1 family peptidyl-tRNA hydrolase
MALFQKKPQSSTSAPLYTLGLGKNVLIVGLGNPGKEYQNTRHNLGFRCLDTFATQHDFPAWTNKKDLKCQLAMQNLGDTRVILVKPTTFMNNSGEAVQAVQQFYKIPSNQMIVVHDELDIPFGQIRTRLGGSSAGHNGIKSLLQHTEGEFNRVRIGIGAETKLAGADFVLQKFDKIEEEQLPKLTKEVESILIEFIYGGNLNAETRSFLV